MRDAEGFVLSGGNSSRMGRNKALLSLGGLSLLEIALGKLRAIRLNVPPRIAGARFDLPPLAPMLSDLHPGCGPLSGIETALASSSQDCNVFLPVDMPLMPAGFLEWMLRRAQITGALATIPRICGRPQPLCAVYHRLLLGPVSEALAASNFKVMAVMHGAGGRGGLDLFDVEHVASSDSKWEGFSPLPLYRWFHNCNSPDDMTGLADALVLIQ
jgi:molybdenum cofactor guanylyltransferase